MTCSYFNYRISAIFLLWIQTVKSMSLVKQHSYFLDNSDANNDVADYIASKGYLPNESDLPKASLIKNVDNDVTYLLSKLSDEQLIQLLNDQPKKNVYDLNDIVKVAIDSKSYQENKIMPFVDQQQPAREIVDLYKNKRNKNKRFRTVPKNDNSHGPVFRLENKPVLQYNMKNDVDPNYEALQKINNLLYSRPAEDVFDKNEIDDEKKELLFDVLVAQLKSLCCKKSKPTKKGDLQKFQYKSLLNDLLPHTTDYKPYVSDQQAARLNMDQVTKEYMFLIINDEIKSNGSDEVISVDPESLERNSSVLLLGPIATPLTDRQLKSVMSRISNEISKPDYMPLLQQLSEGTLRGNNVRLTTSLITGSETRRYIKPHRCNHQSKLARVYGGPKWIICTGYLNLNTPSIYD